jgi:hypothetical protein
MCCVDIFNDGYNLQLKLAGDVIKVDPSGKMRYMEVRVNEETFVQILDPRAKTIQNLKIINIYGFIGTIRNIAAQNSQKDVIEIKNMKKFLIGTVGSVVLDDKCCLYESKSDAIAVVSNCLMRKELIVQNSGI